MFVELVLSIYALLPYMKPRLRIYQTRFDSSTLAAINLPNRDLITEFCYKYSVYGRKFGRSLYIV